MLWVFAAMRTNQKAERIMNSTGIVVRTWNDAPISRRDSDGYADATAMCQANGKHLPHYISNQRTNDYITALADATGLQPAQLVISTTTGPNHLRGTWIHPRLAVDLARWISPQFAVWMDGWFLDAAGTGSSNSPRPLRRRKRQPVLPHISTSCAFCGKHFKARSLSAVFCGAKCRVYASRHRRQGRPFPAVVSTALTAPTPTITPGIHVVANNQRHANWLWAMAVEQHVSQALMAGIASNNQHRRTDPSYQLHLLPPAV
jgi:hypothetical protein